MRIVASLAFLAGSLSTVSAGIIDQPYVSIFFASQTIGPLAASKSGEVLDGYQLTATACFDGWCNPVMGGSEFSTSELINPFTVNDPLTVRLTNLTLTCLMSVGCGPTSIITFFSFVEAGQTGTVGITVPVDGSGPAGTVLTLTGDAASCDFDFIVCHSVSLTPGTTVTANGGGVFSGLFNLGNISWLGVSKINLGFSITGLGFNQTISLPSSLSLTYGAATGIPEPATLSLMALGLGAVGLLIRKRRK